MTVNGVINTVLLNVEGRVATLELNRPETMNALDMNMLKELAFRLKELSQSDDIDVVVIKGRGRAFCAGGDIKGMLSSGNESDFYQIMDCINELVVTLYSMPKITISAINGAAAGLGFSIALATDYILAAKDSKLAMNFIGIGLIPDGGAHFFLERRVGEVKAKDIIWDGKTLTAQEALEKDLVNEVCEGELSERLTEKVAEYLNKPIQAMVKTKKIIAEKNRPQLLKILELEKYGQAKMRQTEDHKEGIQAFIEKRRPHFKGK